MIFIRKTVSLTLITVRMISKFIFHKVLGWKLVGDFPRDLKKYVVIAAPHTSWKVNSLKLIKLNQNLSMVKVNTMMSMLVTLHPIKHHNLIEREKKVSCLKIFKMNKHQIRQILLEENFHKI